MENNLYIKRNILCIDLKSFFASCECVEKNLDPYTTPLVVSNPTQGSGALTLAVTPYLKKQGVKSRGRLYEIPKNIKYIIAKPRMSLYIAKSKEVVNIYLDYISKDDLHIYSIDECFLDVTHYLKMYKLSDYDLAKKIMNDIKERTGLTATAGIGPNMLLAKVAMDIEAKHTKDCIAKWTYDDIKTKLWNITPLTDMWGIGKNIAIRLNKMGITKVGQIACMNPGLLKDKFGIMGTELWNHANGIDSSVISDFNIPVKEKSFSQSQVLYKDYNEKNIGIIIEEMVEALTYRLRKEKKECNIIGFGINYSKNIGGGFYHSIKLDSATDNTKEIIKHCNIIFYKYYEDFPIRKVPISFGGITQKIGTQLNIFETIKETKKEEKINNAIDSIKEKYGKNSIIKVSNLLEDSTAIERNKKIGGHNAE